MLAQDSTWGCTCASLAWKRQEDAHSAFCPKYKLLACHNIVSLPLALVFNPHHIVHVHHMCNVPQAAHVRHHLSTTSRRSLSVCSEYKLLATATGSIAAAGGETGFGRDSTKTRSCTLSLLGRTAHYEKKTHFDVLTLAAVLLRAEAQLFQLSRVAGLGHCNAFDQIGIGHCHQQHGSSQVQNCSRGLIWILFWLGYWRWI